jgi:hypothetical protein
MPELPGGGCRTSPSCWCREGIGELGLLAPALARLTCAGKEGGVAGPYLPYAPALAAAGIDLPNLVLVRAAGRRDALWAAEQALRAGSCHALLAWLPSPGYAHLRRLAVAAEASRAFFALFRPPQAAAESSPACLRLALEPAEGGLRVHILKRRGAQASAPLLLPVKRPFHALGRSALSRTSEPGACAARRLGLPVHA